MLRTISLILSLTLVVALAPQPVMADDLEDVAEARRAEPAPTRDALLEAYPLTTLRRGRNTARAGLILLPVAGACFGFGMFAQERSKSYYDGAERASLSLLTTGIAATAMGIAALIGGGLLTTRNPLIGDNARAAEVGLWSGLGLLAVSLPAMSLTDVEDGVSVVGISLIVAGSVAVVGSGTAAVLRGSRALRDEHHAAMSVAPVWQRDMRGAMLRVSW